MAGKISKERLKTVLEKDMLTVTLSVKGKEVEIEPCMFWNFNDGLNARGYTVRVSGEESKIEGFDALTAMLSDTNYSLVHINDTYKTVEELDAKHGFDNISMAGLLEKYADADRFQLVIPIYDYDFDEFDDKLEGHPALKRALINTEVTFSWHCTTSGSPAKVFTFKLNDETREWLLTHADDYDISRDGFEDLALFKGEKILFSSCTHEHFHTGEN